MLKFVINVLKCQKRFNSWTHSSGPIFLMEEEDCENAFLKASFGFEKIIHIFIFMSSYVLFMGHHETTVCTSKE